MSAETRRLSRERAKRFKKTGKKGFEEARKFERRTPEQEFTPAEPKEKPEAKPVSKVEVVRKKTAGEVIALEDRPGVTPPPEKPKKWLEWREGSPMEEPVTVGQIAEATALGLSIASLGVAAAGFGLTLGAASVGTGTGAQISKAAAGKLAKDTGKIILGRPAVNTVTAAKTASWLTKAGMGLRNPTMAASTLLGVIGSYPFAGFIKEEALQTLSFAVNTATRNDDVEGAEAALEAQAESLDPKLWVSIMTAVPYANIAVQLQEFYKAARIKLEVDARAVEKLKGKLEKEAEPTEPSQPKWIQTADGNWKPNPDNPGWEEQNEEIVWMGG